MKEKFLELCKLIKREGIENLLKWLEKSDFYTAPASTKYHEAYEGGLVEHSVKVYEELVRLNEVYKLPYSEETLAIVSLFHDVCKVGSYIVSTRNVKDEKTGTWHKEPFYQFEENFCFGGHGSKSVYQIQYFMKLTPEEATAINCHMGANGNDYSVYDAFRMFPLAFLLHTADTAATIEKLRGGANGTNPVV